MKRFIVKIIGGIILLLVLVILGRDMIAKASVGGICHKATGLNLSIGGFHSSFLKSSIEVNDLKLYNPPDYTEKTMFFIPDIFVSLDLGQAMAGHPHLREVRLHLAELVVEKNSAGKLNLAELRPAGSNKPSSSGSSKTPTVSIDLLHLQIDKVIYRDFSRPVPVNQEFNLRLDKTYKDIKDVRAIVPIIVGDAISNTALGSLINFRVGDLLQNFQAGGVSVADMGLDQISGVFNSGMGQTATGVVGSVADSLGSLFGGAKKK